MALSPQSPRGAVRSEINVTPLVDVCLVLLIIFMVITPLIQAGVKVDLPRTAKSRPMPGQDDQLTVTIPIVNQDVRLRTAARAAKPKVFFTASP